jgi:hypothetical protein
MVLFIMPSSAVLGADLGSEGQSNAVSQRSKRMRILSREDRMRRSALRHMAAKRKRMMKEALEKLESEPRIAHGTRLPRILSREDKMQRSALRHAMRQRDQATQGSPVASSVSVPATQPVVGKAEPQFFFTRNRLLPLTAAMGARAASPMWVFST